MSSPTDQRPLETAPAQPTAPPAAHPQIAVGEALVLGALHGPAELLPISSSGHIALIPWLLGWDYATSTPSCARRSRSRCTPAPPRRC